MTPTPPSRPIPTVPTEERRGIDADTALVITITCLVALIVIMLAAYLLR